LFLGDTHIYLNHTEAVKTQLERPPYAFPVLEMPHHIANIDELTEADFLLVGYKSHAKIEAKIAV